MLLLSSIVLLVVLFLFCAAARHCEYYSEKEPVLNFLFIVADYIANEEVWADFFREVPRNRYRIFVHAHKRPFKEPAMQNVVVIEKQWSLYNDIVNVTTQLVHTALQTSQHPGDVFAIISGDTVPVKSFRRIYMSTVCGRSHYCVAPSQQWTRIAEDPPTLLIKSHNWMVLNREDALRAVEAAFKYNFDLCNMVGSVNKQLQESIDVRFCHQPNWNQRHSQGHSREEHFFINAITNFHRPATRLNVISEYPTDKEYGTCPVWVWWPDYPTNSIMRTVHPPLTEKNTQGAQQIVNMPSAFLQSLSNSSFLFARKVDSKKNWGIVVFGEGENKRRVDFHNATRMLGLYL
jgi:hypothetical protein